MSEQREATATRCKPENTGKEQSHRHRGEPSLPELLRWLTSITRPVHRPLYISTFLRIINLSLEIILFALAGASIVSVVTGEGNTLVLILALVGVALAKAAAYYGEQFSGHYVAFKALELLRTHVFAALWPKAPAIVARSRSGDVLTSLTRDVDRIEVVYAHTFAPVISAYVVPVVAVLAAGAVVGFPLVLAPAICVALALLVVPFVGLRSALRHTHTTLEKRRGLVHHISDSVFGTEDVVGYGRSGERLEETGTIFDDVARSARTPVRVAAMRRAANLILMLCAVVGVAYVGVHGEYSLMATVVVAAGTLRLFVGPVGVEDSAAYIDHSFAAARRLWAISHAPEAVSDGKETLQLTSAPRLRFKGVSYAYPREERGEVGYDGEQMYAVRDIDIDIPAGKRTVLVGVSGSGKSTLTQLLLRYDDPTCGRILINDTPLTDYTLDSLRHCIVAVAQKNQVLDATIAENIRLGAPEASDEEVWWALEAAGFADEVRDMPRGLGTPVGVEGSRLSGGQVQRLCLARALIMKPKVLVLDEFTASLNRELEDEVRGRIAQALPDVTIVEVTHRRESVHGAAHVIELDRGRIVSSV